MKEDLMGDANSDFPTTIGPDAAFKGQLQFDKAARVLGKFEGEIKSKGQLMVADGAVFKGEAEVGEMRVEGQVTGNVRAMGKVNLAASSRVEGDIHAERLEVAEGAVVVGHIAIGVPPEAQKAAATQPVSKAVETLPASSFRESDKDKDKDGAKAAVAASGKK
jgi:cytoskeletal protein CcmA (bactofilin family)